MSCKKTTLFRLLLVVPALWLAGSSAAVAQVATPLTIEGCLGPGQQPGFFALRDDATGDTVVTAGLPALAAHAKDHRVRVTGTFVTEAGRRFLRATALEHLADNCEPLVTRVAQQVRESVNELRRVASLGVRGGFALDPELIALGVHAEFRPVLDHLVFRPNFEFAAGEVTAFYSANFEAIYRLPFLRERGNQLDAWGVYAGGGPSVSVINQEFRERDFNPDAARPIEFDDWDTNVGLNIVVGVARGGGFFAEVKAGAYGAPGARILIGRTF